MYSRVKPDWPAPDGSKWHRLVERDDDEKAQLSSELRRLRPKV